MPLTEADITHEQMKDAVNKGYLCGKCGGTISIAWGGSIGINGYILRCGNDITHTGITRHDKKHEQKMKESFSMDSTALQKMTETQMVERVNMARFPQDLTPADKKLLAQVAITYGFDPLMGEVSIYQGRPFVSIDGRYRKAQETEQLDGVETRPATKQEREDWQIPAGDYFFHSEVYLKGARKPFIGWGRVYMAETVGGKGFKPVEKNPQRMAEKRAEAQALRKAFHIPLPSIEDIGNPDYDVESTAIDVTTGEIPEQKPEKEKASNKQQPTSQPVTPPSEGVEEQPSPIDLTWLKEALEKIEASGVDKWRKVDVLARLNITVNGEHKKISDAVRRLSSDQATDFASEVADMLKMI
uniref:Uncharacterized protein n=1 Tax=viral metagenome TaxID=1070528 RepID=A0A6M3IXX1_9ZZZZ